MRVWVRSGIFLLFVGSSIGLYAVGLFASGTDGLEGFAVVELFTSEGCSSCPPGEEALAQVKERSEAKGARVITIAWHVDYWDYLGWTDPYGSTEASKRQRWYATALDSRLYTPQTIVDGRIIADYAGDAGAIEEIARRRLSVSRTVDFDAGVSIGDSPGTLRVEFALSDARKYTLEAILLEDGLASQPTAGENRGRTLEHVSTVRNSGVADAPGESIVLGVPSTVKPENASIVVLVRPAGMPDIVAVQRLRIPSGLNGAVTGQAVFPDGEVAAGIVLQICNDDICVFAESDAAGIFRLDDAIPGAYLVKGDDAFEPVPFQVSPGTTTRVEVVVSRPQTKN